MGLQDIAAAVGTPCYVYDAGLIRTAYATLDEAFEGYPHAIHYALKANSALAVVRLMRALGAHADANSLGEVDVATRCEALHPLTDDLEEEGDQFRPRGITTIHGPVSSFATAFAAA